MALGFRTALRGHDLSKLEISDLTTVDGESLMPYVLPELLLQPGDKYSVRPYGVKNRQAANPGSITIVEPMAAIRRPGRWLWMLLLASRDRCCPIARYLFRPANASCTAFLETAVSPSCINSDVKTVLKLGNVFRG